MKTASLALFCMLCMSLSLFAQQKIPVELGDDGVYLSPETMPEYPGGINALLKYMNENVRYPKAAQEKGISGRVIVQFVVMEDGSLGQEKIVRGVNEDLDAEALRVVREMPKWKPGTVDGKAVKVRFTVPVMFRLTGGKTPETTSGPIIPAGTEVKNKTLQGVWQACSVVLKEDGYQLTMQPILKILSGDKTFINIFMNGRMPAATLAQGDYEQAGDNAYVEMLKKSAMPTFPEGGRNEIKVDYLHDNLVKFSFTVPGREKIWEEYWYRTPVPNIKIMAK